VIIRKKLKALKLLRVSFITFRTHSSLELLHDIFVLLDSFFLQLYIMTLIITFSKHSLHLKNYSPTVVTNEKASDITIILNVSVKIVLVKLNKKFLSNLLQKFCELFVLCFFANCIVIDYTCGRLWLMVDDH